MGKWLKGFINRMECYFFKSRTQILGFSIKTLYRETLLSEFEAYYFSAFWLRSSWIWDPALFLLLIQCKPKKSYRSSCVSLLVATFQYPRENVWTFHQGQEHLCIWPALQLFFAALFSWLYQFLQVSGLLANTISLKYLSPLCTSTYSFPLLVIPPSSRSLPWLPVDQTPWQTPATPKLSFKALLQVEMNDVFFDWLGAVSGSFICINKPSRMLGTKWKHDQYLPKALMGVWAPTLPVVNVILCGCQLLWF